MMFYVARSIIITNMYLLSYAVSYTVLLATRRTVTLTGFKVENLSRRTPKWCATFAFPSPVAEAVANIAVRARSCSSTLSR